MILGGFCLTWAARFAKRCKLVENYYMQQKPLKILIVLAVVLLGTVIFLSQLKATPRESLSLDSGKMTEVSRSAQPVAWTPLESREQALPVVRDQDLFLYSFTKDQLVVTDYHTFDAGGASNFGSHTAQASPDARYILFPNKDDNESLYLLSSETLETRKITSGPVEYITDWSPDSKRFIYYIKNDSLSSRKVIEGMGIEILPWDKQEQFHSGDVPGFHVFDIETGIDTHLFPLEGITAFVDASHVLAVASENVEGANGPRERMVIFDIEKFKADYITFPKPIQFGQGQYSFTRDGKQWVFSYSQNPTADMSIIHAEFPSLVGTVVEASTWADVQGPKISPQGRYIAYTKGTSIQKTRVWDTQSKKLIKELDGRPLWWLDEDRFVVQDPTGSSSAGPVAFGVYSVVSNTSETAPLDGQSNQ